MHLCKCENADTCNWCVTGEEGNEKEWVAAVRRQGKVGRGEGGGEGGEEKEGRRKREGEGGEEGGATVGF